MTAAPVGAVEGDLLASEVLSPPVPRPSPLPRRLRPPVPSNNVVPRPLAPVVRLPNVDWLIEVTLPGDKPIRFAKIHEAIAALWEHSVSGIAQVVIRNADRSAANGQTPAMVLCRQLRAIKEATGCTPSKVIFQLDDKDLEEILWQQLNVAKFGLGPRPVRDAKVWRRANPEPKLQSGEMGPDDEHPVIYS